MVVISNDITYLQTNWLQTVKSLPVFFGYGMTACMASSFWYLSLSQWLPNRQDGSGILWLWNRQELTGFRSL